MGLEELQLVDPSTRELAPAVEAVLSATPDGSAVMARELFQDCVEMRTPVFSGVAELARRLPAFRREVAVQGREAGVRISASGLHPTSDPFAQKVTPGERYARMEEELGALARLQIIYALHVHVGVPDEEAAIRATNALLRHVPILTALGANSPFWNGIDTGFASARVKIRDTSPRSGLPPTFHSWEEFEGYTEALVAMGNIPDFSWFWWDVRPHPRHGTVELRVPDAQTEPGYAIALAALTQCLVETADGYAPEDARFVSENKWRAIRRGLDARLYNFATGEEKDAGRARDRQGPRRPTTPRLPVPRLRGRARRRPLNPGAGQRRRVAADGLQEAGISQGRGRLPDRDHGAGLRWYRTADRARPAAGARVDGEPHDFYL